MSNYASGHDAEQQAAEYLKSLGFEIVDINWKTRWCEIDIIASKSKRIYFVEVKSRRSLMQGSGLEYVTSKKLKQMGFAAEMWVKDNAWTGEYQLAAIGVDAGDFIFVEEM